YFYHEGWQLFILPYMERSADYQLWMANRSIGTWNIPGKLLNNGSALTVPSYVCPSDPLGGKVAIANEFGEPEGPHSNYACNAGPTAFGQTGSGTNLTGVLYPKSNVRFADITDGTSNTLLASEILLAPDAGATDYYVAGDRRGRIWNAQIGEQLFCTLYP